MMWPGRRGYREICVQVGSMSHCRLLTRCKEKCEDLRVLWVLLSKAAVMNIPDPGAEVRQSCQKEQ